MGPAPITLISSIDIDFSAFCFSDICRLNLYELKIAAKE